MNSKVLTLGIIALVLLAAACSWWVMRTTPVQTAIDANREQPPPLPTINMQLLEGDALHSRTSNGTLPINVEGVGRTDPFAGA